MTLWPASSAQCFTTPEQGSSLQDAFIIEENVDLGKLLKSTIMLSIENWISTPSCKDIMHNADIHKVCITSSVQQCLEVGGAFEPGNMDMFLSSSEELQAATWLTDLQATPGMEYCHYQHAGKPELVTKTTCSQILEEIGTSLHISNAFVADQDNISRLVLKEKSLVRIPVTYTGEVLCLSTPHLQASIALSLSLAEKLEKLYNNIKEAYNLINSPELETLLTTLENCGNAEFIFGNYSSTMMNCIRRAVPAINIRSKRASVLSYILGDGAGLDNLQNNIHHLEKTFDKDIRSIAANELNLKFAQQLAKSKLSALNASQKKATLLAVSNHWSLSRKVLIEQASTIQMTTFMLLFENINEVTSKLTSKIELTASILLHQDLLKCTEVNNHFGCLNIRFSTVHISMDKISLGLHFSSMKSRQLVHLTCIPADKSLISVLHGQHGFVKEGEVHTTNTIIKLEDLKNKQVINKLSRSINEDQDLFQDNLLILEDQANTGFWCKQPMFVIYNNNRVNCTTNIRWEKTVKTDIVSANGIIRQNSHEKMKLKSKQKFTSSEAFEAQVINKSDFRRLDLNSSLPFRDTLLQSLSTLSPVAQAYLSISSGSAIILIILLTFCCCKFRSEIGAMCKKKGTVQPADSTENRPTGQAAPPLTAEEVAVRTRQVFRDYISRSQNTPDNRT